MSVPQINSDCYKIFVLFTDRKTSYELSVIFIADKTRIRMCESVKERVMRKSESGTPSTLQAIK